MARTPSTMLDLGTVAPDFNLVAADGDRVQFSDADTAPAKVVAFICNHCPFVIHIQEVMGEIFHGFLESGVDVYAINSNDVENYPDDSPEKMLELKQKLNWEFSYLYDEDQSIAKAYRAACTPDFYVFSKENKLVYRGQFDDSRPGNDAPVTGVDLKSAVEEYLQTAKVTTQQKPSIGCNIKWKKGSEPDYH